MKRWFYALTIMSLFACSVDPYPGYRSLASEGVFYKVLYFDEKGKKPIQGDMMRFKMCMYEEDSIWWSAEQVQVIRFDTGSSGLRSELDLFHEGDSLSILMEPESLWKEFGFLESMAKSTIDVHIKVLEVIPEEKWLKAEELDEQIKSDMEQELLSSFLDTCSYGDEFILKDGGVLWRVIEPGNGKKYLSSMDLTIQYQAFLMDGSVVDDRLKPEDALAYKIGMQGQLIPGLVQVIRSMEQYEKVEVILPSSIAFGNGGSVGGVVPPWNPVRFVLLVSKD